MRGATRRATALQLQLAWHEHRWIASKRRTCGKSGGPAPSSPAHSSPSSPARSPASSVRTPSAAPARTCRRGRARSASRRHLPRRARHCAPGAGEEPQGSGSGRRGWQAAAGREQLLHRLPQAAAHVPRSPSSSSQASPKAGAGSGRCRAGATAHQGADGSAAGGRAQILILPLRSRGAAEQRNNCMSQAVKNQGRLQTAALDSHPLQLQLAARRGGTTAALLSSTTAAPGLHHHPAAA